ncbi:MAG: LON peptidase substrate-binding domain-containing protein [Alkalispirochaeta sp.]
MTRVPVFPLGLVLMPRMPLPLHIFEERYRLMVQHCLDEEQPFGVVLHTGTTIQSVGCLASIENVINRYDDGRMDILTVGTERFRIQSMHEDKAFLEADVDLFQDLPVSDEHVSELQKLTDTAVADLKEFAHVAGYEVDQSMLGDLSPEELSFLLSTTDVFGTEEKQQLIELRSTTDRLERAARAIHAGRERRAMTLRIQEILGTDDEDINHLFN